MKTQKMTNDSRRQWLASALAAGTAVLAGSNGGHAGEPEQAQVAAKLRIRTRLATHAG